MADPSGVFFDGDGGLPRVGEGGDGGEAGEKLVLGEEALEGFDLSPIGFGGEDGKGGAGRRKDGGRGSGVGVGAFRVERTTKTPTAMTARTRRSGSVRRMVTWADFKPHFKRLREEIFWSACALRRFG